MPKKISKIISTTKQKLKIGSSPKKGDHGTASTSATASTSSSSQDQVSYQSLASSSDKSKKKVASGIQQAPPQKKIVTAHQLVDDEEAIDSDGGEMGVPMLPSSGNHEKRYNRHHDEDQEIDSHQPQANLADQDGQANKSFIHQSTTTFKKLFNFGSSSLTSSTPYNDLFAEHKVSLFANMMLSSNVCIHLGSAPARWMVDFGWVVHPAQARFVWNVGRCFHNVRGALVRCDQFPAYWLARGQRWHSVEHGHSVRVLAVQHAVPSVGHRHYGTMCRGRVECFVRCDQGDQFECST